MNFSKLLSVNFGDRRIPQTLEATFRRKVDYSEPQGREVRPGNRCGNNMDTPWEEIRRWGSTCNNRRTFDSLPLAALPLWLRDDPDAPGAAIECSPANSPGPRGREVPPGNRCGLLAPAAQ